MDEYYTKYCFQRSLAHAHMVKYGNRIQGESKRKDPMYYRIMNLGDVISAKDNLKRKKNMRGMSSFF